MNSKHELKYQIDRFRSHDLAGFSNPSPIFEFTKHNHGDGSYMTFELYEPDYLESTMEIKCERLISIRPSIDQTMINFYSDPYVQSTPEQNAAAAEARLGSVPENISSVALGINTDFNGLPGVNGLVWDRSFKFRFTSISSGNSFDINTTFKYSKLSIDGISSTGPLVECTDGSTGDNVRESRRNRNRENFP